MADKTENTRFGSNSKAIAQDFAEQLKYSLDADVYHTTPEGRYQALAYAIRDRIIHQWDLSRKTQRAKHSKRVYYLSLEFLMGRAMTNNIINMGLEKSVKDALIGMLCCIALRQSLTRLDLNRRFSFVVMLFRK